MASTMLPLYRISDWRNRGAFVYALVIGKVVGYRTTHGDWRVALGCVLVYWDILFLPKQGYGGPMAMSHEYMSMLFPSLLRRRVLLSPP